MKKIIALCLALVFALGTLTACTITWERGKPTEPDAAQSDDGDDLKDLTIDTYVELDDANTAVDGAGAAFENGVLTITKAGAYSLKGTLTDGQIIVDTEDDAKVKLLFDGVSVHSETGAALLVLSSPKETKLLLAEGSENTLSDSADRTAQEDDDPDAVIFSKDDLEISGLGTLNITSTDNGISGKDDIKITGGVITVDSASDAIEANDMIAVADGTITINSQKDGLHAEDDEDNTQGSIYLCGGTFTITAASDGIQGTTIVQIDDGNVTISASEGIEATWVQINGGTVSIDASDDGINAASKSSAYTVTAEFNGGDITINMGQGDTDGIDTNGNLIINGGTLNINAQSPFDYDGTAQKNGGTIIVNGSETDEITNQFGGGMGGGPGGMQPGGMQPGGNR